MPSEDSNTRGALSISMKHFKVWLDRYPFIRSIVRESMMPRVWTLQPNIHAVKPLMSEFTINKNPDGETDMGADDLDMRSSRSTSKTITSQSTNRTSTASEQFACMTISSSPTKNDKSGKKRLLMPLDSKVVKEGELMKIGKRTGTMRTRYYMLRDQAMFIYANKSAKIP